MNSRQEQYKLDQQLMRELRNGKSYETKWYIVNEIGFGDVAAVDTLLPRTRFIPSIFIIRMYGDALLHFTGEIVVQCYLPQSGHRGEVLPVSGNTRCYRTGIPYPRLKLNRNKRRCETSTRIDSTSWS